MTDFGSEILNSNEINPTDAEGRPIPVTIPIALAPGVTVVYTTRLGGASTGDFAHLNLGGKMGDDPAAVAANREALARAIGAPISLVSQVHSGVAVDVDEAADRSGTRDADGVATGPVLEADGQVTSRPGLALGMFAADCLPVLMADPQAGVIGAAHCGRRGLERGVIGATVELMRLKGADPARIVATLGPAICGDCYEVGDEIADAFDARFPGTFTLSRFGKPGIDINRAALLELAAAGIPQDNVVSSRPRTDAATQYLEQDAELAGLCAADDEGPASLPERIGAVRHSLCTLENPLWFSHRRAALAGKAHEGRMLALIVRA